MFIIFTKKNVRYNKVGIISIIYFLILNSEIVHTKLDIVKYINNDLG